jgi:hypothetical protein
VNAIFLYEFHHLPKIIMAIQILGLRHFRMIALRSFLSMKKSNNFFPSILLRKEDQ